MRHAKKVKRKVNALLGRQRRQARKPDLASALLKPVRLLSGLVDSAFNAIAKVFK